MMKKILMTMMAVIVCAITAHAQTVYVSDADGGNVYHKSKSCSYLGKTKKVGQLSAAEAKKTGRHECKRCFATKAEVSKKARKDIQAKEKKLKSADSKKVKTADAKKEKTTEAMKVKSAEAKKAKPAEAKKAKPAEAKKVKPAEAKEVKPTKATKVKSAEDEAKAKKNTLPARDEKGRFVKN